MASHLKPCAPEPRAPRQDEMPDRIIYVLPFTHYHPISFDSEISQE
jgi:hypothetical protein